MYQVFTRTDNESNDVALKMLNICGFSFIDATQGDKCAYLGLHSTLSVAKNIHLPPMETLKV